MNKLIIILILILHFISIEMAGQNGLIITVYSGSVRKYSFMPVYKKKAVLNHAVSFSNWLQCKDINFGNSDKALRKFTVNWFKKQPADSRMYYRTITTYDRDPEDPSKHSDKILRTSTGIVGTGKDLYDAMSNNLIRGSISVPIDESPLVINEFSYFSVTKFANDSMHMSEIAVEHKELMRKANKLVLEKQEATAKAIENKKDTKYTQDWLTISESLKEDLETLNLKNEMDGLNQQFKQAEIEFNKAYDSYRKDLKHQANLNSQIAIADLFLTAASFANNYEQMKSSKQEIENLKKENELINKKLKENKPIVKNTFINLKHIEIKQINTVKQIIKIREYKTVPAPIYKLEGQDLM